MNFQFEREKVKRCNRLEDKVEKTKTEERAKTSAQINTLKKEHKAEVKGLNERISLLEKGILHHKVVNQGEPGGKYISRYVVDLQIIPTATELRFYADGNGKITIPEEYRSEVVYGPVIKAIAVDLYSDGVVANDRIGGFINAISGNALELSEGSIYGFCNSFAQKCSGSIKQIEDGILNSSVVGTDATTVTTNGVKTYIRSFSTRDYVLYKSMQHKNIESNEGDRHNG